MKQISFLAIVMSAVISTRCDLFNKVDDISFEAELSESLTATENATATNVSISQTFTIDALDNSEIQEYQDKLKGITVKEVRYEITNFTGDNTSTLSGNVILKDPGTNTTVATVAISSFNLNDAFTASTVYTLPLTEADYQAISDLLMESKTAAVTVEGTLSKTPVNAVVKFTFVVNVKAEVLN